MLAKTEIPTARATQISPPNIQRTVFKLRGLSPYMCSRFSEKAMHKMRATQEAGSQSRGKKVRTPRDLAADAEGAKHIAVEGWAGIPAGAFRTACIDVCRLVGFKMTLAKLSIFIEPDGFDVVDGTPLVRINGTPEVSVAGVRNSTGVMDLRARPMWREWSVDLKVEFDEDQFSFTDVSNLLLRAGLQCGVGEGRPNSKMSTGIGFGRFTFAGG